jgi:hypothetical protein
LDKTFRNCYERNFVRPKRTAKRKLVREEAQINARMPRPILIPKVELPESDSEDDWELSLQNCQKQTKRQMSFVREFRRIRDQIRVKRRRHGRSAAGSVMALAL